MEKPIYEMSLLELVMSMNEAQDQILINRLALEMTYRLYVPFKDKTFEELLVENGYRVIEKGKNDTNSKIWKRNL